MEFSMKVTTSSSDCQRWVDGGVLCVYGFQREEGIRCFEKALTYDSNCAMAHYFIAYCNAANYNDPDGLDYCLGFTESQKALELSRNSSLLLWEKMLIEAQIHRFCDPVGSKPMSELHDNFAKAMKPVYEAFGEDNVDVAAIYAEALMMLRPWALWTSPPIVKPAASETLEVVEILEKALKKSPDHPGLCHYYIHAMELSDAPEKALPAADMLRTRYFYQGHLLHMPSHIDMWVGQYKEAIEVNKKGILSDEEYVQRTGRDNEMYKMYRMHNLHFIVWASMFDGQYSTAMEYAEKAEKLLGEESVTCMLGDIPLGSKFLESFASIPWHVLVRFGKWEEIVSRPVKNEDLYPSAVTTAHYARGIAFAVMGKLDEADRERQLFYSLLEQKEALQNSYLFNNVMHDPENHGGILDVAEAVLNGEVEYHKGNFRAAFKHLRVAVERDIGLPYDEPWGWMTPARHVLGALLLEHGETEEAEAVYREDLKQYKNNLWSLLGLHQALKQQKKEEEAEKVYSMFMKSNVRSDIQIGASCLCATKMCCQS